MMLFSIYHIHTANHMLSYLSNPSPFSQSGSDGMRSKKQEMVSALDIYIVLSIIFILITSCVTMQHLWQNGGDRRRPNDERFRHQDGICKECDRGSGCEEWELL